MLFNSFEFLIFFIITFGLYYLPGKFFQKNQLVILLLASFFFYSFEKPVLLLLLLFSVLINTICSYSIYKVSHQKAKRILTLGVIFNLGVLAFFKYSPLIASTLSEELSFKNGFLDLLISVPLPIGISFYTFEGISLLIDLHKGKTVLQYKENTFYEHLTKTAFFISFFPHLIAGPILKAREFYPQMGFKAFKDIQWEDAVKKIIIGFFLKMVVADNLKDITGTITFPYFQGYSTGNLILLLFGYSMQIFADFAGYSLIAIGLGALFGYSLPKNFNFPYIASSFSEFWRRWHISLSTWLRDYLYISLGGNKKGEYRTYLNLFLVMLLGGFWHGAAWSYAVWGAMHGFFLLLERFILKDKLKDMGRSYLGMLIVFTVVTFLWLLFKLSDFSHVVAYIQSIFQNTSIKFKFGMNELSLVFYSAIIISYHLIYLKLSDNKLVFTKYFSRFELLLYSLLLFLIFTNSGSQGSFIYFQF